MMKNRYVRSGLLAIASLLVASCEIYPNGYSSFTYSTNGYSSSVAWTAASYDANGFPIYGYAYGRPVYGYTHTGRPIYVVNQLYAGCYVPDWRPAPWCNHHHHYPSGVHRHASPPHHGHGHKPGVRPPRNAPIHKNPQSVLGKQPHGRPHHADTPPRPHQVSKPSTRPAQPVKRPDMNAGTRATRPAQPAKRPDMNAGTRATRPAQPVKRPDMNAGTRATRPAQPVKRPDMNAGTRATRPAQPVKRPDMNAGTRATRPAQPVKRPSTNVGAHASRPSRSTGSRPAR